MIAGQLWAEEEAPVPIVYESPSARYLIVTAHAPDSPAALRAKRR